MPSIILTSKIVQYRLLALAAALTLVSFLSFQVPSLPSLEKIHYVLDHEHQGRHNFQAFELEGVSAVKPFPDRPPSNRDSQLQWLLDTLDSRLQQWSDASRPPSCSLNLARFSPLLKPTSYQSRAAHPISIAIDLRNSAHILPIQSTAILTALSHLLPSHNIYVSIFENDSTDSTPSMLGHLAAALERLGIDGLWITSSRLHTGYTQGNRINMLAELRNAALKPLIPFAGDGTIVFINDVILCASDILELVLQTQVQSADVAVGIDWSDTDHVERGGPMYTRVYDDWVLRGINGQTVYEHGTADAWPLPPPDGRDWLTNAFCTQSADVQRRWLDSLPFPVYAGWGGMAAFRASLFTRDGLRFRSSAAAGWAGGSPSGAMGPWGRLVADPAYLRADCPADSECGLVMRDVWNLRRGAARVVLAPQVNTAYTAHMWRTAQHFAPFVPRRGPVEPDELIDWAAVDAPSAVVCLPGITANGTPHDPHNPKLFRFLTLDPLQGALPTLAPSFQTSK